MGYHIITRGFIQYIDRDRRKVYGKNKRVSLHLNIVAVSSAADRFDYSITASSWY